ncbi:hypothetical protein JOE09_000073 [Pantoea coffeiphila]|nr:hypothetical protein [Pantoea coffeiphila]
MDNLRRNLLRLVLPSTLLTLFCNRKAAANITHTTGVGLDPKPFRRAQLLRVLVMQVGRKGLAKVKRRSGAILSEPMVQFLAIKIQGMLLPNRP